MSDDKKKFQEFQNTKEFIQLVMDAITEVKKNNPMYEIDDVAKYMVQTDKYYNKLVENGYKVPDSLKKYRNDTME